MMTKLFTGAATMILLSLAGFACNRTDPGAVPAPDPARDLAPVRVETTSQSTGETSGGGGGEQTVVLAGGCFWCTEAVFEQLAGVSAVVSGYAGGTAGSADYRSVSSGATDHAEVIQVTYDPAQVSYGQLLKVFFTVAHDPTQKDYQGPDHGRQYRSAVFYQSEDEKAVAQAYIDQLNASGWFPGPIVTTLEPLAVFYPAEAYHQDYVRDNPAQPYVAAHALPKVAKVRRAFPDQMKD